MDLSLLLEPTILTQVLIQGLVRGSMYALMASGLSLIFGIMGVKNFSHGEMFMIGVYVMFFMTVMLGAPFPLGIAAAAVVLFFVGVLIERFLVEPLRKRAGRDWLLDAFVLTIGIMIVLQNLALIVFGSRRRGITELIDGHLNIGENIVVSYERLLIVAVAVVVGIALFVFVRYTYVGKAMRATAQDPEAAQTLGIDIARVYTYAYGIGAALAGLAGALLISIFPAYPTVGFHPIIKSIAAVILGGLGNVQGAIAAGLLLGLIEGYTAFFMSAGWQSVMTAVLVILILIFKPAGLFSRRVERP